MLSVRKIAVCIHRILGLLLCLLFLMWFVSGIVMIYHQFPRASQAYLNQRQKPLPQLDIPIDRILALVPDSAHLQSFSIEMRFDRPIVRFNGRNVPGVFYLDTLQPVEVFNEQVRDKTLRLWCDAPIERIDTLYKVDQWIPFGRLNNEMPIYKYHFADTKKHQLYMTARDGRVLQFTDKDNRFWAWIGAIPHWVYFTFLRQHQTLWTEFVKWTAGIGCLMCLVGWGIGIHSWRKRQKVAKDWRSPYRKGWMKWHFISGMFFGLFAITFAFSGMMSLTDLPDWLKKAPQGQKRRPPMEFRMNQMLPIERYALDYRKILAASDSIKSITWSSWNQYPYYKVQSSHTVMNVDASDSLFVKPFLLTESMVRADVGKQLGDSIRWKMELLTEEDGDYFGRRGEKASLPVYRVSVDDALHTKLYYHPETLSQRRVDDDGRLRRFLYSGLHSLNFKLFSGRPLLWNIVMHTLLLGGTVLSLTGVVLSLKWIVRKVNKILTMLNVKR